MNLPWIELKRRPGRFATATVVLSLLAALLMLLGGLLDGLLNGATSGIKGLNADVLVYSSSAQSSFPRSRIEAATREQAEKADGVDAVGGLGVAQFGVRVNPDDERELVDAAIFGYEISPEGVPQPPADGEAYAAESFESSGISIGETVRVGPMRTPLKIVGWAEDLAYAGQRSMWVNPGTWREILNANKPVGRVGDDVFQALVVKTDAGADPSAVAAAIDQATDNATESLTKEEAIQAIPGVKEQSSTFGQIIGVTLLVAVIVVALFFALLTVERISLYGIFKAIGATTPVLFRGLMLQAVAVTAIASTIGVTLAVIFDAVIPPDALPYRIEPMRIVTNVASLLFASVIGCAFVLRRVLKIDPASAIGNGT